jgi:ATP-dependent DNA helicase PIF1
LSKHTNKAFNISLPDRFKCRENTISSLIDTIYSNINTPDHSNQCFSECIILSSINKNVNALNKIVLDRFPGCAQTFYSVDFIPPSEQVEEGDPMLNYPVEHLNEINGSTLPLTKLELKAGCLVIILKNLDQLCGVCNGSRGILTRYRNGLLKVKLFTEQYAGETVFIPKIPNQPSKKENNFKFMRKQFSIKLCFAMTINKLSFKVNQ